MPPGIVSIRCLRSVGLFSRTNGMPASRKRMGGGTGGVAAKEAQRIANRTRTTRPCLSVFIRIHLSPKSFWRTDLRFPRDLFLLLLVALHDLLVFCHDRGRLLTLARGAVGVGQLEVEAAIIVKCERLPQMRDGFGVLAETRQRQPQRRVGSQQSGICGQRGTEERNRLLGLFQAQQAV